MIRYVLCAAVLLAGLGSYSWFCLNGYDTAAPSGSHESASDTSPVAPLAAAVAVSSPSASQSRAAQPSNVKVDEEALKQSSWMGKVQEGIRKAEYNITWQDKASDGGPGGLHAANRANNLRAYFREDGVQIVERETGTPDWDVQWQFKSWGRVGTMREVLPVAPEADELTDRLSYKHPGIEEWFINDERGLEHGFTIASRPKGDGPLRLTGVFAGSANARNAASPNTLEFEDNGGRALLQYAKLEVTDAGGGVVPATLREVSGETHIIVHDKDAVYPIDVDPIFLRPLIGDWQTESNQDLANMGWSVSGAGDVNADGYSDVIIGAYLYDNGESNEGAAFVFMGSASGPVGTDLATAAGTIESNQFNARIGYSVSAAGDVNGDGFADVIVGGSSTGGGYDVSGAPVEGAAFVFHGSASGIVGTDPNSAASVLYPNQSVRDFGFSVSGAGDVNGDGYSDIIIGARQADLGQTSEGAAYLFVGSVTGIVGTDPSNAAAVMQSNQASAFMGHSVSGAGDVNGDGFDDVLVGAFAYDAVLNSGLVEFQGESVQGNWTLTIKDDMIFRSGTETLNSWSLNVQGLGEFNSSDTPIAIPDNSPTEISSVINIASSHINAALTVSLDITHGGIGDLTVELQSPLGTIRTLHNKTGGNTNDLLATFPSVEDSGAVFIFLGRDDSTGGSPLQGAGDWSAPGDPSTAATILESSQPFATLSRDGLSSAGDVNGDGYADVIVGAWGYDNGEDDEGAAFLFLGSESGLVGTNPETAAVVVESNQADAHMGVSASGAGDINGDGFGDIIVGAYYYDNLEVREGAAFVFLGRDNSVGGSPIQGAGVLASPGNPSTAASILESNRSGAWLGTSVSGAGDVNGDGFSDVIVGAPLYENGNSKEGAAFVYFGAKSGLVGTVPAALGSLIQPTFNAASHAEMGFSVSGAGDVNGDGFDDIIVGAPKFDNGQPDEGAAFIYHGSEAGIVGTDTFTAATLLESDQARCGGCNFGPLFGASVSSAGDVNGDGFADVIVGSPRYSNGEFLEGAAFLFLGSSSGVTDTNPSAATAVIESNQGDIGNDGGPAFGASVSGAGDINGDGFADIVIGAPDFDNGTTNEGAAFIYFGSIAGLVGAGNLTNPGNPETAAAVLESDQALSSGGPDFGISVSGAGDVNGDGYADLIIGAPNFYIGESPHGAAFVFMGSVAGLVGTGPSTAASVFVPNQGVSEMGYSVSDSGDVNADGYDDVIIGAPMFDNGEFREGAAFIFLGSSTGLLGSNPSEAAAVLESNQADASMGRSVSGAGDVNGDGFADVLVGAAGGVGGGVSSYDNGETDEGAAFLFLGSTSGILGTNPSNAAFIMDSNQADARMGFSLSEIGDVNGDGFGDVIIGSHLLDNGQTDEGGAYVYLGASDARLVRAQIRKSDDTLLAAPGIDAGTLDFNLKLTAFMPPMESMNAVRLEWEVKPYGEQFDGQGVFSTSDWVLPGNSGQAYNEPFSVQTEANGWRWRARVLYAPMNKFIPGSNPLALKAGITLPSNPPHGRWYYPQWATVGPSDFRTNGYRPPTNPAVSVSQDPLLTTDGIVATLTVASASPANPPKAIQYEYVWDNGSRQVPPDISSSTTNILDPAETKKGEIWTCTVRAWDGVSYSHLTSSDAAPEIQNTAPSAPTVAIASAVGSNHGSADNMVCQILVVSADPDVDDAVDFIQYKFDWYKDSVLQPSLTQDFGAAISSTVPFTELSPGDTWECRVTARDNEGAQSASAAVSETVTILDGGAASSFLTVDTSNTSVVLGQSMTLEAKIIPNIEPLASTFKGFDLANPLADLAISPSVTVPATTALADSFTVVFTPNTASEGRDPWEVAATWTGNATYAAAKSLTKSFTVLKAQPALSVTLSASSAPLGFTELSGSAVLSAALPTELQSLLSGLEVDLFLRAPDGASFGPVSAVTDSSGVASFSPSNFSGAGITFDAPGTWQFLAEFAGDENFKPAFSPNYDDPETPRLTIKDGAGYAIIVVGKLDEAGEGQPEHTKTADFVYRAFRDRGFAHEDIYYLAEGDAQPAPDIFVDDTSPSEADLEYAVTTWALGKMNASEAPLYMVWLDHGLEEKFYVYSGAYDATRIVTPQELDGWLDNLQSNLTGAPANQLVTLIYGACHSGSFIPAVSGPNRMVITSSSADEVSHRGVREFGSPDNIRDGEPFVTELFRNARVGKSFKESFEIAAAKIDEYTSDQSNGVQDASGAQTPLLDDNGDGIGTTGAALLAEAPNDGAIAHGQVLGFGVNAGDSVGWVEASPTLFLGPVEPMQPLFARCTDAPATGHVAWIEVKSPAYAGSDPASTGAGTLENYADFQQVVELEVFAPDNTDPADGEYDWSSFGSAFDASGTYKVYYFIKDGNSGEISSYLLTTVYRQDATNQAPPPVALDYPANNDTVATHSYFTWSGSIDPEGDPLTYRFEMANDSEFTDIVYTAEGLTERLAHPNDVSMDNQSFFWRVVAVDTFGAESSPNAVNEIGFDNFDNPAVPGAIVGYVRNSITNAPIAGALVALPGFGTEITASDGSYIFAQITAGSRSLSVSAAGHQSLPSYNVFIPEGGTASANIALIPDDAPYRWGEVSGDGRVGTVDASHILQWLVADPGFAFPIAPSILKPQFPEQADVSGNGSLSALDASYLLQWKVGFINTLPADANGDGFGPEAKQWHPPLLAKQAPRPARVWAEKQLTPEGKLIVRLFAEDLVALSAYQFTLSYNGNYVVPLSVTCAPDDGGALHAEKDSGDSLSVSAAASAPLGGRAVLAEVVFDAATVGIPADAVTLAGVQLDSPQGSSFVEVPFDE